MDNVLIAMKAMSVKYEPKKKLEHKGDILDKRTARKLANQYSIGGKKINSSSEVAQSLNQLNEVTNALPSLPNI